jgi:hypothetical protein
MGCGAPPTIGMAPTKANLFSGTITIKVLTATLEKDMETLGSMDPICVLKHSIQLIYYRERYEKTLDKTGQRGRKVSKMESRVHNRKETL